MSLFISKSILRHAWNNAYCQLQTIFSCSIMKHNSLTHGDLTSQQIHSSEYFQTSFCLSVCFYFTCSFEPLHHLTLLAKVICFMCSCVSVLHEHCILINENHFTPHATGGKSWFDLQHGKMTCLPAIMACLLILSASFIITLHFFFSLSLRQCYYSSSED